MGGVCSGGAKAKNAKVEGKSISAGKLRSVQSIGRKKDSNSYSYTNGDDFDKTTPQRYNSGELVFSFSRELKPSTPARTGAAAKVCFFISFDCMLFVG